MMQRKFRILAFVVIAESYIGVTSGSNATSSAFTRISFGRKIATGKVAPQPSSFTGLRPGVQTGGVGQVFVPGKPYLNFTTY